MLVAGAFGYGGSVMVQNAGISRTSVTHAALLIGAVPVLVAIIAAVWYRAVARPVAWFGFAVSLGGVGLVTAGSGGGGATTAGDGLVLASLLLSATVTVAQGRLLAGRDPVAVTAVQFLGATLASLPIAAVTEGVPAAPAGAGVVLAVVALALAGTLLPFTLFAFGQSRVSAEVAGAFLNLEPLVGAIAGAVVFGDPVGLVQVAGGAAILAGIALSSLPLLAGRRVARRAALVTGAAAARAGAEAAPARRRGRDRAGADGRHRAGPRGRTVHCHRHGRMRVTFCTKECAERHIHTLRGPARQRRNAVFVGVRGGKFGAGRPAGAAGRGAGHGTGENAARWAGGGTAIRPRAGRGAAAARRAVPPARSGRRPGALARCLGRDSGMDPTLRAGRRPRAVGPARGK